MRSRLIFQEKNLIQFLIFKNISDSSSRLSGPRRCLAWLLSESCSRKWGEFSRNWQGWKCCQDTLVNYIPVPLPCRLQKDLLLSFFLFFFFSSPSLSFSCFFHSSVYNCTTVQNLFETSSHKCSKYRKCLRAEVASWFELACAQKQPHKLN